MIKSELITKLAEENPHLTQRDIERVVGVILERMIRAGFDPYAANVWISRNSADAVVFDSTNAKALHMLALVCAGVSPWLTLLPPRWAWWTMAGVILCGASAVVLAYVAV